jgi:hypothetical protein
MKWTDRREEILAIAPPEKQGKYCPIPHSVFLGEIEEELYKLGYTIKGQRFLTANNNQILTGTYNVSDNRTDDIDISPTIYFTNSYNKMKKASIHVGAMVLVCKNGMLGSVESGSFSRKHLGDNALTEFRERMKLGIQQLQKEFERLIINKTEMQNRVIETSIRNQLIGEMYIDHTMINPTQLSILNREIKTSKNFKDDTLWSLYNNITESLKENHPMNYNNDLIKVHTFFSDQFNLTGNRGLYKRTI